DDSPFGQRAVGNDAVYVACDDPDTLFERATAAGAEVVRGLVDEDYGSRGVTVRDPDGNLWSFGTYQGE
ncbi:MAG: VOC family protein, partial [Actinobacteria bacterium]|nr:VOC family protein [Actinomycetota bacterium]